MRAVASPRPGPRPARAVGAAATVFALVLLAGAALSAWREAAAQGWSAQGLGWLAVERFARARPLAPAVGSAAAVLLLALAAARARAASRLCRAIRVELVGHPLCALAALAAALLLPGVVVRGTRPAPARRAPSVVLVVVDSWRADHAGFLGYGRRVSPALDRLAAEGVVFERAIAPSSATKPSVATLLTGLAPARHRAIGRDAGLAPELTTIVEVLRGRGWQTAMWSADPDVAPSTGFAQGAERFRDHAHAPCHPEGCGRLDEVLAGVERWLADERDPARPFCLFVHVSDATQPFEPPAGYRGTFDRSALDPAETDELVRTVLDGERPAADLTEAHLARVVARYDEELLALDQQLGPFLAELRRAHPTAVIVLAGAHGEELLDHGALGHGHAPWRELVHVPLVLLARTLEPGRVATQVRLMDVAPTLLELLGLPDALPGAQGDSLLPVIAGLEVEDRPAPLEVAPSDGGEGGERWLGVSDGTTKVLRRDGAAGGDPTWHLFDLATDPLERTDVAAGRADEARALLERLDAAGWRADRGRGAVEP